MEDVEAHRLVFSPKIYEQWQSCEVYITIQQKPTSLRSIFGPHSNDSPPQTLYNTQLIFTSDILTLWNKFPKNNMFRVVPKE